MNLTPGSPAEAVFALGLPRHFSLGSGERVICYLTAQAAMVGTTAQAAPIAFTKRDIGRNVFPATGKTKSAGSAWAALKRLEKRRVLEITYAGKNDDDPSECRFLHPTHWAVEWDVPDDEVAARIERFLVASSRAAFDLARAKGAHSRAASSSARVISTVNDAIRTIAARETPEFARAPGYRRARNAGNRARQGGSSTSSSHSLPSEESDSLLPREEREEAVLRTEADERADQLLSAVYQSTKFMLYGPQAQRVRDVAATCNGQFPDLLAAALDPKGPARALDRVEVLENILRGRPFPAAGNGRSACPTCGAMGHTGNGCVFEPPEEGCPYAAADERRRLLGELALAQDELTRVGSSPELEAEIAELKERLGTIAA